MNYWLFKTEPQTYSIDDLAREPQQTTCWDGVRNYQARNFIRDKMAVGDDVLLHHSSADPAGIVGWCRIVRGPYPDSTAFDAESDYFDPKSREDHPIWYRVDVQLMEAFPRMLTLLELRGAKALAGMELLRRGSRLSIQPVTPAQFRTVLKMAKKGRGTR